MMASWLWAARMFRRDLKTQWPKFLMFSLAVIMGVAALVATDGFAMMVRESMHQQSKTLLGADLVLTGNHPWESTEQDLGGDIPGERAQIISFASMIQFEEEGATRLARIRAIDGDYPFYGELETDPPGGTTWLADADAALVDEGLMSQFNIEVGDSVVIGQSRLRVAARLLKIPGEAALASSVGPRVFIPMPAVDETELIKKGSRVSYRWAFKTEDPFDPDLWALDHRSKLGAANISWDTVKKRQESMGSAFNNLFTFLNLMGIGALILGGIGVSSSMYLYARAKIKTIAVLRCLGAVSGQVRNLLIMQAAMVAVFGTAIGVVMGVLLQQVLPGLIQDFLPVQLETSIEWTAVVRAMLVSLSVAFCFALLPLSRIWAISPLQLMRMGVDPARKRTRSEVGVLSLTLCVVITVTFIQSPSLLLGSAILAAFAVVLLITAVFSAALLWAAHKLRSRSIPYPVRQGISNLYRPRNQSLIVLVAVGLVTFLMLNHLLVHRSLMGQFSDVTGGDRPNLILFDIQSDQREGINELVTRFGLNAREAIPMVTMRLAEINGAPTHELVGEDKDGIPEWAARWEYRSSYRATLRSTERVIEGTWQPSYGDGIEGVIPISLEESIAHTLHVGLDDRLTFDVQGIPLNTRIASLREVDWESMQPNFYVLFPPGVLEDAPQIFIQALKTTGSAQSAQFQRELVEHWGNVSAIDLGLLLKTVDDVIDKARLAIQFMAAFFLGAALVVLTTTLLNTRFERFEEASILRALGARRRVVAMIMASEYASLGLISALLGTTLALLSSYLIATRALDLAYVWSPALIVGVALAVTSVTVAIGTISTWGVWRRSVMSVLKAEKDR